jgi:simple sugar transport system permease protein
VATREHPRLRLPKLPRQPTRVDRARQDRWASIKRVVLSLALSVVVFSCLILALGVSPFDAFDALYRGAMGNKFNLGQTVMITSVLACTGLAAAIPFSARLWNVGVEGQLWFGAFMSIVVVFALPEDLPSAQMITITLVAATLAGAVWGFVPGLLKATINANEVITSLMMVFIAIQLGGYAISTLYPSGANQTEAVPTNALLPNIWEGTLVTLGFPIAVGAIVIGWILMSRTSLGFEIRAVGLNRNAARLHGSNTSRVVIGVFSIGGAFGGLGGGIAVLGINGALVQGFSPNYGFIGVAVALVARLNPAWILPSAFLFAAFRQGSNGLEAYTGISTSVGEVLMATFVILLVAMHVVRLRYPEGVR